MSGSGTALYRSPRSRLGRMVAERSYIAMVRGYAWSGGITNDILHAAIARRHPPRAVSGPSVVLGTREATELAERVRTDGFVLLPEPLDPDLCDHLVELAGTVPAHARSRPELAPAPYRLLPDDVPAAWIAEREIATDRSVQRLASDPGLLGVAQAYLGCQPIMSNLAMWWSRPAGADQADIHANAQAFHFDMDRPKWLKLFIYLTDVTPTSGPHIFVKGSHRQTSDWADLRRRGYARLSDHEVEERFGDRVVEVCGPRGTMFFADTRALHRGKLPETGERLVLQYEFADSLFGAQVNVVDEVPVVCPQLWWAAARLPGTYRRWGLVGDPPLEGGPSAS